MSALNRRIKTILASNLTRSRQAALLERLVKEKMAEVAAKAWDEGRRAEKLAWEHAFDGHPVPEGEVCDECAVENPYRKAVQS